MPRRYWLPILAVVGLAIGAYGDPIARAQGSRSNTAKGQQQVQRREPEQPPIAKADIERIAKALEAANAREDSTKEEKRAQDNLDAQRAMAKSAARMFWVGLAELITTLIGVGLVGWTLYHTREAAKAARDAVTEAKEATKVTREIGEAQVRAYLSCEDSILRILDSTIWVWPAFKNTGQSPASKIRIYFGVRLSTSHFGGPHYEIANEESVVPPIPGGGVGNGMIMASMRQFGAQDEFIQEEDIQISVHGFASWLDVFGKEQSIAFTLTQTELSPAMTTDGFRRDGKMYAHNRTPISQEEWEAYEAEMAELDGEEKAT